MFKDIKLSEYAEQKLKEINHLERIGPRTLHMYIRNLQTAWATHNKDLLTKDEYIFISKIKIELEKKHTLTEIEKLILALKIEEKKYGEK